MQISRTVIGCQKNVSCTAVCDTTQPLKDCTDVFADTLLGNVKRSGTQNTSGPQSPIFQKEIVWDTFFSSKTVTNLLLWARLEILYCIGEGVSYNTNLSVNRYTKWEGGGGNQLVIDSSY